MVTNIKCKAKNPNTCRYHNPGAETVALKVLKEAQHKYDTATSLDIKEVAYQELQDATSVYDATDGGYQELRYALGEARMEHYSPRYQELFLRMMRAKVARVEEKQTGASTEAAFLTAHSMKNRFNKLEQHVFAAQSDHFLDTFDAYSEKLKKAADENDSYTFVSNYNDLIQSLHNQSEETSWREPEKGKQWDSQLSELAFKGKVIRNLTGLSSLRQSMTFEA